MDNSELEALLRSIPENLQDGDDPGDPELVRKHVNGELDQETDRFVLWAITSYRTWYNLWLKAMDEKHGLENEASK